MNCVIAALCSSGAYPGSDNVLSVPGRDESTLRSLQRLQALGFVQFAHIEQGRSGWQLTADGMRRISLEKKLAASSPALAPRLAMAVDEMTTWDLLCLLDSQGWTLEKAPSKPQLKQALPPYVPGQPKRWFLVKENNTQWVDIFC